MSGLAPPVHLPSRLQIASLIDHTMLKPTATAADIDSLCEEAKEYRFRNVCVNPCFVRQAARRLRGTGVGVCAVVGFPLGAAAPGAKAAEAGQAIKDGATEIDMVSRIGALKGKDHETFSTDIASVAEVCRASGTTLKVIIECCYLTEEEKVRGARLAAGAGADFVKTSTGFGPGGATEADVALLRSVLRGKAKVKAAGGIGTLEKALVMIRAGADRIGTSSGPSIIEELPQ